MKDNQYPKPFISWPDFILLLFACGILLMIWLANSGCYTEKKALQQVDKALGTYPVPSSKKFRTLFPCVTIGRVFFTDSVAYKNSIDSLAQTKAFYDALIFGSSKPVEIPHTPSLDSICNDYLSEITRLNKLTNYQEQYIIRLTDDFNNVKPIVQHDSVTTEDLSKVMEKDVELQVSKKETITANANIDSLHKKIGRKNTQLWWLYIILGVQVLYFTAKIVLKNKLKFPI